MQNDGEFSVEHNGCSLHARIRGAGPPVLLIQGVGVHGDGWAPQVDALAGRYQCLTFDNRGLGGSQPLGETLSLEQMAADAGALMDKCGWKSAHVIGHSMGGLIAQHLALTSPGRIRSLSLLCTFARGGNATKLTPWMLWVGARTRIGTRRQRRHAFLQIVLPPDLYANADLDALADKFAPIFGRDLADHPPVEMKQLSAMGRYDATPRLGELRSIPTLVVSAQHDPIATPDSGRTIAAGIPGARYVELPGASHGVPIYQPERMNTLLLEHLDAVEANLGRPRQV